MPINTIDKIPRSSPYAASIEDIAVFRDLTKVRHLSLPAKIDFFMLIMCEQGNITVDYDTNHMLMSPSTLAVLRPGHIVHGYRTSADWRGHVIIGSTRQFDKSLSPMMTQILPFVIQYAANPVIKLTSAELASQIELRSIIEHKVYNFAEHQYKPNVIRSLLEALFFDTLGIYTNHSVENKPTASIGRRKETLLNKFVSLVSTDFRQHRSVAHYAQLLHVTPKHLSTTIKEASGRTASQWIDTYVIAEAKLLMRHTGMTIQEVAKELNFTNQSFFGKYFKNLTGQSPRQFRTKP